MSSYSLMGMDNNLSLGDLSDTPAPAAAPTTRVAPVEEKHGDRKAPASKTPKGEMSDKMAIAIAARLKATKQTNEKYLAMLSEKTVTYQDIEAAAGDVEMPLESFLESLEEGAKVKTKVEVKQGRLTDNIADAKQTRVVGSEENKTPGLTPDAQTCSACHTSPPCIVEEYLNAEGVNLHDMISDLLGYRISDKMVEAILKRSQARFTCEELYGRYVKMLERIAQQNEQTVEHYLRDLEFNADGVALENILESIEEFVGDEEKRPKAVVGSEEVKAPAAEETKTIMCQVCLEDKKLADFEKLRCENQNHHHIICTECLNRQTLHAIRNINMRTLACPDPTCKTPFFPEATQGNQERKEVKVAAEMTEDDKKVLQAMGTKQCPRCNIAIQKNGGCQYVTCTNRGCGHDFCWNCLGPFRHQLHDCRPAGAPRNQVQGGLRRFLYNYRNKILLGTLMLAGCVVVARLDERTRLKAIQQGDPFTFLFNGINNGVMYVWDYVRNWLPNNKEIIVQTARRLAGQAYDALSLFDLTRLWGRNAYIEANFAQYLRKN